jgi:RHS repeat-associated protein
VVSALAFAAVVVSSSLASASEICGDGQDNNGNGLTDEGCYPFLTTGVCESPLSCDTDGAVAPLSGSLVYQLPADIAPRVPYGPPIAFRRIYTSMYAPASGAPAYRKPMGERWQHSYMSWLDKNTGTTPWTIVLHTNHGQDILFTKTSTSPSGDMYTPQTGFHFQYLVQSSSSPFNYTLKTLNGDSFVYDGTTGKLIEIWDTLATPNKVTITYDGSGMTSTVTDAACSRRLNFGYTSSLLTSVQYQINSGTCSTPTWTTYHTTSYSYTSGALTGVTIGGASAQTNVYTSGYLTQIQDAGGNNIASFAYATATPGKVVQLSTPSGNVGYDYSSSRTVCSGKTVAYFNKGNTTACKVDSDCGSGYLCGGNTDPTTASGVCYLAARCLTTSSPSEDVVTSVSSFGPGGGACTGACLDAQAYSWNTGTGTLDLGAIQDPAGNYSARAFNTNGLPTTITFGDADSNPSNGNGTREVYLFYDSNFPGKLSEVRRKSDINVSGTCSTSVTSGCARTLYTYSTDGKLATVEEIGFALDSIGRPAAYDYTTTNSYDSHGRLTQTDGPLAGSNDLTVYDYWSSTDALKNNLLQDVKRKKDSTNYLTTTFNVYDFWGHPTTSVAPDNTLTCETFDSARGYLTEHREAMAGQTSCTSNSADLVTDYLRDSALRLTKITRPDGGCEFYEYDASGRLSKIKRRDDCVSTNSGDNEEFTRNAEGLATEIDWKDASGTITKKQPMTYYQGRQLNTMVNPVDTSKYDTFIYDARGIVNEIDGAGSLSKNTYTLNADGRISAETRYYTSTASDSWTLTDSWEGILQQITDGDSKTITASRDDLGRKVQVVTVDSGTTYLIYDAAGRPTSIIEAYGTAGQVTRTLTYDNVNRVLTDDNDAANKFDNHCNPGAPTGHPEIQTTYDAPPSCPLSGGCNNTAGRVAYVDKVLLCSSTYADYSLDQLTYYSYDAAGRVVEEYITDDSGRVADHQYQYNKDGSVTQVTMPSGTVIGWTFDSTGSNSDLDRVTSIWRSSTATPVIDTVLWAPFGPFVQYNQENAVSTIKLRTVATRNLAYRISLIKVENQSATNTLQSVTITEDAKGRVTQRDYYPGSAGFTNSHFKYDEEDRVLCETTNTPSSCPTSGTTLKNNHNATPPFNHGGDWQSLLRPQPGTTGLQNTFDYTDVGNKDTFDAIFQNDGSPALGTTNFGWDSRGNRTYDDNTSTLTHDRRDYTYDGHRNLVTVTGQYYTGSAWDSYTVTSAFDAQNRRVFKAFVDTTTGKQAQWFFYYDPMDRLTEVRYTPDISASSTYSVFQLFWLGDRLTAYWQTDYPSTTTSRRYVGTDESGRPIDMWSWPSSGNAARVWNINPSAWGFDTLQTGSSIYQPVLLAGQYQDGETVAWQNDGATVHRPALALNGHRTYDAFTGNYLQMDAVVESTWDPYGYAGSNPVGHADPLGLSCLRVEDQLVCWPDEIVVISGSYDPGNSGGAPFGNGFGTHGQDAEPQTVTAGDPIPKPDDRDPYDQKDKKGDDHQDACQACLADCQQTYKKAVENCTKYLPDDPWCFKDQAQKNYKCIREKCAADCHVPPVRTSDAG